MKKITNRISSRLQLSLLATICSILLCCGEKMDELIQKPTFYVVTEGPVELSTYGGEVAIEFLSNVEWTISSDASWVSFADQTTGNESATINALIGQNISGAERKATITLKGGEITKTMQIIQKYRDISTAELSITTPTPININFQATNATVSFTCNVEWSATTNEDWIQFDGATTGREDGSITLVMSENTEVDMRIGTVTLTAGTLVKTFEVVQTSQSTGSINLLDTPEEDYSFESITVNRGWPAKGSWGGSPLATPAIGAWGGPGVAVRVVANDGTAPARTGKSYLFLPMTQTDPNATGYNPNAVSWLWRKLSGLVSGRSYTFSFWYRTVGLGALAQTGNVRLGVVTSSNNVPNLTAPLNGEVTFGFVPEGSGVVSSADEPKHVSYTFAVPTGTTEVFVGWVRNGVQQPYIDDMSLVMNP